MSAETASASASATRVSSPEEVLAAERAVNERYMQRLVAMIEGSATIGQTISSTRSQVWAGAVPVTKVSGRIVSPLVGRVALDEDDPDLGTDFYIGAWRDERDGVQVVCWAAPVAQVFFEGRDADHELAAQTVARRSFEARDDDLIAFDDVIDVASADGQPVFQTKVAALRVPAPPKQVARPALPTPPRPQNVPPAVGSVAPAMERDGSRAPDHDAAPTEKEQTAGDQPTLRAEAAVRRALERPRTGALRSVLATLQPDQYRLVTWPQDTPLIVQGQPGTGKTIIATHRVGYLTHPENEHRLRRVALVGPTDAYADHVRGVERQVGGRDVEVFGLEGLMRDLTGLNGVVRPSPDARPEDYAWRLGTSLDRCARTLRSAGVLKGSTKNQLRSLIAAVRQGGQWLEEALPESDPLRSWRAGLPSWEIMASQARYRPFLAAAAQAVGARPTQRFDHLVVDEAQDLHPLEWRILSNLMRPDATWSIFGDMNQRHSDWTAANWDEVACDLELTDDEGAVNVQVLEVGYRSTKEILRYANRLLPRGERGVRALREGIPPVVQRCGSKQVTAYALARAGELASRHPDGTTAIITTDAHTYSSHLTKLGWRRRGDEPGWKKDGQVLIVLPPDKARGLEFDGVVVVEPADFPQNLGRNGPLYTSLTRATKELVVVHSKAMPRELRGSP